MSLFILGFVGGVVVMGILMLVIIVLMFPESKRGCKDCEWYFSGTHHSV